VSREGRAASYQIRFVSASSLLHKHHTFTGSQTNRHLSAIQDRRISGTSNHSKTTHTTDRTHHREKRYTKVQKTPQFSTLHPHSHSFPVIHPVHIAKFTMTDPHSPSLASTTTGTCHNHSRQRAHRSNLHSGKPSRAHT